MKKLTAPLYLIMAVAFVLTLSYLLPIHSWWENQCVLLACGIVIGVRVGVLLEK